MKATYSKSAYWSIDKLTLWDKNPRSIKTERFNELKVRLERLGQTKPLRVTKDGIVIGGNMRLRAMQELGWTDIWVSISNATTDKEIFDEALTDNEEFGYYEQEQLAELALDLGLTPLELQSYELNLGGTTTLDLLIDKFGPEVEEDEVPEVDEINPPVSKLGEIYQLGNHRLMCGDSTDFGALSDLMDGAVADLVFTDPPYGVNYQSNMRTQSAQFDVIKNDDKLITEWIQPVLEVSSGWVFIWTSWKVLAEWLEITKQIGQMTNMIIWDKGGGGIGDLTGTYASDYEVALVFNRGAKLTGERLGSVWSIGKDSPSLYEHPTQKPVGLAETAMKTVTVRGQVVLDVFGGSGSTLIAADKMGRISYTMELDPKYCDVIRKRYYNLVFGELDSETDDWMANTPAVKELEHANR